MTSGFVCRGLGGCRAAAKPQKGEPGSPGDGCGARSNPLTPCSGGLTPATSRTDGQGQLGQAGGETLPGRGATSEAWGGGPRCPGGRCSPAGRADSHVLPSRSLTLVQKPARGPGPAVPEAPFPTLPTPNARTAARGRLWGHQLGAAIFINWPFPSEDAEFIFPPSSSSSSSPDGKRPHCLGARWAGAGHPPQQWGGL